MIGCYSANAAVPTERTQTLNRDSDSAAWVRTLRDFADAPRADENKVALWLTRPQAREVLAAVDAKIGADQGTRSEGFGAASSAPAPANLGDGATGAEPAGGGTRATFEPPDTTEAPSAASLPSSVGLNPLDHPWAVDETSGGEAVIFVKCSLNGKEGPREFAHVLFESDWGSPDEAAHIVKLHNDWLKEREARGY